MLKKKDEGIEFLRMCATIGVIVNHIGICWISSFGNDATCDQLMVFRIINGLAYWPVPIFMMITGTLLMSKKEIDYRVSFMYFKRIAILLLIFGSLFASMELFFQTKSFSVGLLVNAIKNMIEGNSWKHLWYLYMLLGIYLILPMLKSLPPPPPHTHTFTKARLSLY